jgi:sugar phosphate isomerase/epimerase
MLPRAGVPTPEAAVSASHAGHDEAMSGPDLRIGCQTFTWEMLGSDWTGDADDLVRAIASAGYAGIEITDAMIGDYAGRASVFARRLSDEGLTLAALAFGSMSGFTEPAAIGADLEMARRWVDFAAHFSGAAASMGSATVMSDGPRETKFGVAADVYNRAAEIGRDSGIVVAMHPSSHPNTLLLERADYDRIFALLDAQVGWVPDTGHMLRGGMNPQQTMADYAHRIRYVHLKDADAAGDWAMLGDGVCDIPAVVSAAAEAPRFNGWLIVEEESGTAAADPAAAVRRNRETARRLVGR